MSLYNENPVLSLGQNFNILSKLVDRAIIISVAVWPEIGELELRYMCRVIRFSFIIRKYSKI